MSEPTVALEFPRLSDAVSDIELMELAASGEPDAFAQIYDRHAPALLALAQRMLPRTEDALDLLHDVFLEAWQHVREYDSTRASARTWLLVRMRSRALDRRIRNARGIEALPVALALSLRPAPPETDQRIAIARALAVLDADVRCVLELTYFEGLTAIEISERTGTPVGTVRSRLARGIEKLREALCTLSEDAC